MNAADLETFESLEAENRRLRQALRIAMAYMPHGLKYAGPFRVRSEDADDLETCRKALRQQP